MISPTSRGVVEDPTNHLHGLRPSVSESYLEKDLMTCSHVYLRCARVRRPLQPLYNGPFPVISRGTKNFRIQRGTHEEVVSVDRLKAAVSDIYLGEPCGALPPAPPFRSHIPPFLILPPPTCPLLPTATTSSSTSNTTLIIPSAPLHAAFGLSEGNCDSPRLLALHRFVRLPSCLPHTPRQIAAGTREACHQSCESSRPINTAPSLIGWRTLGKSERHTHALGSKRLNGGRRRHNWPGETARGDCLPGALDTHFVSSKSCPTQPVLPDF
ncbi:hypothetical protein SprV_0802608600 [Sparganum proliferum]